MARRKKTETTLDELVEMTVPAPTMIGDQSILDGIRQRKLATSPAAQAQLIKERRRALMEQQQ